MPVPMPRSASLSRTKTSAEVLREQCRMVGLPVPFLELKFHKTRRWRFDLCFPGDVETLKLGVEIDGAVWTQGRHTRGGGVIKDNEKLNEACIDGWLIMRFIPQQVTSWVALATIERFFAARGIRATGVRR